METARFRPEALLKRDLFSTVERGVLLAGGEAVPAVRRDTAATPWASRPLAVWLARREARALGALPATEGVPSLLSSTGRAVLRTHLPGRPLQEAGHGVAAGYFGEARRLLVRLHRAGVTHNDTAKEPNWLVTPGGHPALVDFQLAQVFRRRGRLFRLLAREDLRHLLKHKRTYAPAALTPRERAWLATPSGPARFIRKAWKPIYTLLTRRLLGWQDREGRGTPRPARPPPRPGAHR